MDEKNPNWLEEFEELANTQLGEGSACKQIHPIIEGWYSRLMNGEPPQSRPSVMQAMACLSTEIMADMPEDLLELLGLEEDDTDSEALDDMDEAANNELMFWVQEILMIGRAFQMALDSGELDDL
ncbi:MAG: hypothetical protein H6673_07990 [Anaerolineales bacterium]|nr:hypothetical protein [Anaerolineales bacterium]